MFHQGVCTTAVAVLILKFKYITTEIQIIAGKLILKKYNVQYLPIVSIPTYFS